MPPPLPGHTHFSWRFVDGNGSRSRDTTGQALLKYPRNNIDYANMLISSSTTGNSASSVLANHSSTPRPWTLEDGQDALRHVHPLKTKTASYRSKRQDSSTKRTNPHGSIKKESIMDVKSILN
ncbi:hypothetical protein Forpi1262_v017128 [Fusarium oxysporum f. sp. raphani]|uniref:Uncharacterized protein n=1 Tax=Fusarium oxysporum f. sp. raphani TaxID=96318 RepID=A0A8J5NXB7_FUSOX|nr:hypothetical protein Forpi1262_v017645 [Fusarium oxysporum f. sp. raphani]KAG7413124.1 hypothetical protein Forpi1262_v017128 [Fusarium oxysporum f. sp. raphani]